MKIDSGNLFVAAVACGVGDDSGRTVPLVELQAASVNAPNKLHSNNADIFFMLPAFINP